MAFLFGDTFNHYATADLPKKYTQIDLTNTQNSSTPAISANGPRSNNALRLHPIVTTISSSGRLRKVFDAPVATGDTIIVGFRINPGQAFTPNMSVGTNLDTSNNLFVVYQAGSAVCWLRVNADGSISFLRGTTVVVSSVTGLTQGIWQYVECKIKLHASAGTVDVRLNGLSGSPLISSTGLNTTNTGDVTFSELGLPKLHSGNSGTAGNWDIADLYVCDGSGSTSNDFLGDVRGDVLLVNAAGAETNWTPDSGSNYARVNEASIDSDTSYVSATTAATKDTYKTPTQAVAGADIFAIQVNMGARKTDAGAAGLKAIARIGGTDYLGTELGVPSTYAFLRQIWDRKPSDSSVWADADIGPSATQFGIDKST
jgi:hypothetical protein